MFLNSELIVYLSELLDEVNFHLLVLLVIGIGCGQDSLLSLVHLPVPLLQVSPLVLHLSGIPL